MNPIIFTFLFFFNLKTLTLIQPFTYSSHTSNILQEVLESISVKHDWNLDDIQSSEMQINKARFSTALSYEFQIRFGKRNDYLVFRLPAQVDSWTKLLRGEDEFVEQVGLRPVLEPFKVEGPIELRVQGGDDRLSLLLPMNTSHSALKRILVGEGITLEVLRAQEASYFHLSHPGLPLDASGADVKKTWFWPFWESCSPLIPVRISGDMTLVAYRTRNPNSFIKSSFLSRDTIQLLPEKCYISRIYEKLACPIDALSSKISMLEDVLKSLRGNKVGQYGLHGLRGNVKALTIMRFQLELEKTIPSNETRSSMSSEWKTIPHVERLWFDIIASAEEKMLKPLSIKKVRPFIAVDTVSWSKLMSNISFTKSPSILVSSEALTLDVKW